MDKLQEVQNSGGEGNKEMVFVIAGDTLKNVLVEEVGIRMERLPTRTSTRSWRMGLA